ncbi:ABC transporter permease subunit [Brevibacillus laterosporus]|uniref:Glycine betaine transport system permease protein OpuAB n=1 Tax=Brevibacillus laterosporus LMG 15441 TaxID=1042163 RepID=A0A075R8E6_BRELA|nr:ABC transporter permease/substrate binding protein [Brevibacillus laterosporus]AIG28129.1 glycine betaine transport system permease protein OpuAB [Brevibacillus laterosporus LMG 15441]RJL09959.1 ABC transporter permease subunit [Brevibacillus laterosporus]TPH08496.1 ABC transporter permease subunit [Brevibacillus laterosporus]
MNMFKIPLGSWIESLEAWFDASFGPLFAVISAIIGGLVSGFEWLFMNIPALLFIVLFSLIIYFVARWRMALFSLLGLLLIYNLGYWPQTMMTLAQVLTAAMISILLGVPIGIWCAKKNTAQSIVTPILDFMQTMPAFVYLLPAVTFFSLGVVPGVIASVIFAIPPTIRLTNLGIRQVPEDLVEAADAFGSTPMQKLIKLQLPLAIPSIMAGINQTIMLSLSMVVISSMIGAQGLGSDVYRAVTQTKTGVGFEAGIAVVILAIILDRFTQTLIKGQEKKSAKPAIKYRRPFILASIAILIISSIVNGVAGNGGTAKNITLSYVAWDSEIASTHVVKQVLEQRLGYQVNMLQVEAGPMWTGVATKSADALVAAWLPKTHASFYAKNKDQVEDLGANLEGTRLGLVVPEYMNITSIDDLRRSDIKDATKATIIGIEPGAGLMSAATKMLQDYHLTDWTLMEASSAAMATELQKAYSQQKPIVVTGWTPHWMFAKMKLKYLDDPQKSFGEDEQIHTIVRLGLQEDLPDAYQFLRQFKWTPEDMAQVMVRIQEGVEPDDAAKEWVDAHPEIVEKWLAGIELK